MNDITIIQRAQNGDIQAIGTLYDRHHAVIFQYVWWRVYDRQTAEDLTGEVFMRMVTGLPRYIPTDVPFQAWLYRIAHNLIVDYYRKENRQQWVPLEHAEGLTMKSHNPEAMAEQHLTIEHVKRAMNALEATQREVVLLRFLVGMSLQEVADMLEKTVTAVKSLQYRGLTALRTTLAEEGL